MEEKVKEVKHIMIPVKEYRKLVAKIERQKLQIKEVKEKNADYYKWWREEEAKTADLEKQLEEAKEIIKQYKEDYEKRLGISELQKVKEMQDA